MEYGTMLNNQLIRHKAYHEGDKPIVYTSVPTAGFVCTSAWEEREDGIYQVWSVTDIPIEPPSPDDELTDSEALGIITGGVEDGD